LAVYHRRDAALAESRKLLHEPKSALFRPAWCCSPTQECRWWVWPTPAGFQNVRYSLLLKEERLLPVQGKVRLRADAPGALWARPALCAASMAWLYRLAVAGGQAHVARS